HEDLNRSIHILDVDALLEHFVTIHRDELLWHVGQKCRRHAGEFRTLACGGNEGVGVVREELNGASRTILENEREAARRSDARYCRRRERERHTLPETGERSIDRLTNVLILLFPCLPVFPFFECHEQECVV